MDLIFILYFELQYNTMFFIFCLNFSTLGHLEVFPIDSCVLLKRPMFFFVY